MKIEVVLTDEQVDAIVDAVVERLEAANGSSNGSAWLDTRGAAEHLATTPARIHDLVALKKLTPRRDGRRLVFRREDLDGYLESGR